MRPRKYAIALTDFFIGDPFFTALSMDAIYSQKMNPQVTIPNPYKDKVGELLEKGVEGAKEVMAKEQKEWEAKVAKKPFDAAQGGHKKNTRKLTKGEGEAKDAPAPEKREGGPAEPVTEGEMKPLMDLLGNPDLKDNLKKMFGDMFNK